MTDKDALCPWCGGSKVRIMVSEICCPLQYSARAYCLDCGAEEPGGSGVCDLREDAEREALEAWNDIDTHHIEQGKQLALLEAELARVTSSILDLKDDYRREYCGQSVADYLQAWAGSVLNKGEGKG